MGLLSKFSFFWISKVFQISGTATVKVQQHNLWLFLEKQNKPKWGFKWSLGVVRRSWTTNNSINIFHIRRLYLSFCPTVFSHCYINFVLSFLFCLPFSYNIYNISTHLLRLGWCYLAQTAPFSLLSWADYGRAVWAKCKEILKTHTL